MRLAYDRSVAPKRARNRRARSACLRPSRPGPTLRAALARGRAARSTEQPPAPAPLALRSPGPGLPPAPPPLGRLASAPAGSEPFPPEQRSLLDGFGKRVSLTLHRAELLDSATRSNDRLKTGLELTLELASALDYREVIRRLLRRAVESIGADRASLALVEGSEMIVEDGYDRDGRPLPIGDRYAIPLGSPTDRAVRTGRPKVGERFDSSQLDAQRRTAHAGTRPGALIPLTRRAMPLFVRPFANPESTGTEVSARRMVQRFPVKALSISADLAMITVAGNGMLGVPGIAARPFGTLQSGGVAGWLISQPS